MIDVAKLEAVLRERLPGFEGLASCDRLSAGASRETYRLEASVGGAAARMALRRSEPGQTSAMDTGPGLDTEAKLFAAVRGVGVPGPEVFLSLKADDGLGEGFVMEWVEGETLGSRIARGSQFGSARKGMARQCGDILARLHRVDVGAEGLGAVLETLSPEQAVAKTMQTYTSLNTAQPMIVFAGKWLLANLPKARAPSLVHGDFRNGNLMVRAEDGVVAVLDWELAHVGDPMRDLGWLCTRSWRFGGGLPVGGFGDYEDLFAGYEAAGGELDREAVRFWEVFGSYWWAVGCLSMAQTFRRGDETSPERPIIGRRSSECQVDLVNMLIPGAVTQPEASARGLSTSSLPMTGEMLQGVRDFLRGDAAGELQGRNHYLARVSANVLDIVLREIELGVAVQARELETLAALNGASEPIETARARLCAAMLDGSQDLSSPALQQYLRDSVVAQVMIDQPDYPGAREALAKA